MREWLKEGFEYDLWANRVWVEALPKFKDQESAAAVLHHVHFALALWLDRILDRVGEIKDYEALPITRDDFARTAAKWLEWLDGADLATVKSFTRLDGSQFAFSLGDVARHVVNHGTYHRGHLRGLAQAEGLEDFEDTDFVRWLRETGRAPSVG